ncbi:MAG: glycosyltransferase [Lachnospiraceae bacterium]
MANPVKKIIFDYQLNRCHKRYESRLQNLSAPYQMWIDTVENKKIGEKQDACGKVKILQMDLDVFVSLISNGIAEINGIAENAEIEENAEIAENVEILDSWIAVQLLGGQIRMPSPDYESIFGENSQCALAYADEDMTDANSGRRYGAWMKPDASPDTLWSFFYIGSLLFINGTHLKAYLKSDFAPAAKMKGEMDSKVSVNANISMDLERQILYDFLFRFSEYMEAKDLHITHIPQVLFHGQGDEWQPEDPKKPEVVNKRAYWGYEPFYDKVKLDAMKRRGLSGSMRQSVFGGREYSVPIFAINETIDKKTIAKKMIGEKTISEKTNGLPRVSVIIPSKDNVDVLATCLKSLTEKTEYPNYEIILVDNGSSAENQKRIMALKESIGFEYIYEPMDFNFSKMCNLGVANSKGDYILLLNDDMEIISSDWLSVMVGQASLPHVGAVGAKLLYPDTDLIQHAGITNLWVGPAHKLLKEHDNTDYYYGRNVLPYDMIGVTAACLLVSRDKYLEAGGFCEKIAVSYNDVDFCFSLYDCGYYNVIRNDVVLYHHESVSRGDDALSEEKWDRLLHEKDICYGRHPSIKGKDPFYSPNLAGFKHKYFCSFLYPYEQRLSFNKPLSFNREIKEEWHNNCLTVTIEHVRLERKLDLEDEKDVYWIEGWAYVLGMDSSRYEKKLLLTDEVGQTLSVVPFERYRPDVVEILPEQTNVALSGFSCRIKREDLKAGEYRISVLLKDTCSRQRLYKECEERLVVD